MGLLVAALSDEELIHYAGIDESAQLEMARRSVSFRGTYLHELESLRDEVDSLEQQLEEASNDSAAADDMASAIREVRDLTKDYRHMERGQLLDLIEQILDKLHDF